MWSDNTTDKDFLGYDVHIELLKNLLKDDTVYPITIGIFGDWGSGKSSIMELLKKEIENENDEIACLYFNGWVFEGYDDAKAALMESIIIEFEDEKKFGEEIKDNVKKLLGKVNWMRVIGLGFKNIALPAISAYASGGLTLIPSLLNSLKNIPDLSERLKSDDAEEWLSSFIKEDKPNIEKTLVREFREEFSEMLRKSKIKKLIIFIDDLDRCTPDRIIDNLEAIKLFLNVENTAFIIGADQRIVKHAIDYRYNTQFKNTEKSENKRIVTDYLEKLIQLPYFLPKLSDSEVETYINLLFCQKDLSSTVLKKVLDDFKEFRKKDRYSVFNYSNIINVLSSDEIQKLSHSISLISRLSPLITECLNGNPRQIKRFLNTFILRKKLADVAQIKDFKDDILAKLMILENSKQELFEQLSNWQMSQKGEFKEFDEIEKIVLEKGIDEYSKNISSEWCISEIINWIKTPPALSGKDLRDYFWVSRDKLSSLQSNLLIPPHIRDLISFFEDEVSEIITKENLKQKIISLSGTEISIFYEVLGKRIINDKENIRLYQLLRYSIEENILFAKEKYIEVLKTIGNEIPRSEIIAMKNFIHIPEINNIYKRLTTKQKK
jgi:predicted KAP-like P-loop ATPase